MSRETCWRCHWPLALCWCSSISPIDTQTKFVLLMHHREFKRVRAGTGRFTHICLKNSCIRMGESFEDDSVVKALIADPGNYPALLFPGVDALNLSDNSLKSDMLGGRRLVVFILDATWILAKKMYRVTPLLQALPKLMFTPSVKSRFVIKKQPHEQCLSTIEATHEMLLMLEASGLDTYEHPAQMLDLFVRMQEFQIKCMLDPDRKGYRLWGTERHTADGPMKISP